jgi:protein involved in polysaccharide export with SLBB domain
MALLLLLGCASTSGGGVEAANLPPSVNLRPELPPAFRETQPETPPAAGAIGDIEDLLGTRLEEETYRLRGGDLIQIDVYDHPDLSIRLRVPREGKARYPLIGDVEVRGRTLTQL